MLQWQTEPREQSGVDERPDGADAAVDDVKDVDGEGYNLKAHPTPQVEMDTETFMVRAQELEGAARAQVWPKLLAESPSLREFDARTTRRVPLFLLTRAVLQDVSIGARRLCMSQLPRPRHRDVRGRVALDARALRT